ncbi:MAG: hypothetical protein KGN84_12335 [Acidobacteriota bacterium]|nr:hypothetical protein [Acidobacteriota bacterium]
MQLHLAIGLPVFAMVMSSIGGSLQFNALGARLTSLESTINARITSLDTKINFRLSGLEARFETLIGKVIGIDNRLTRVEAILERH